MLNFLWTMTKVVLGLTLLYFVGMTLIVVLIMGAV